MKNNLFCSALSMLLLLCSCAKDPMPSLSEQSLRPENHFAKPVLLLPAAADRSEDENSCDNIPAGSSFVSIRYRLNNGGISPPLCFDETELKNVLLNSELTESQVDVYIERLFYDDKKATPELAFEVGALIASCYTLPHGYLPDCYSINAMGRSDYPGDAFQRLGRASGFMDCYTVRQAKAKGGCQIILEGGFSGIRLKNKSTGAIETIAFTSSLDDLIEPLIASGFSEGQAEKVAQDIMWGKYSIRQVWDIFQFRVAPNLPFVQNLSDSEVDDWELWHAGIGVYAADGSVLSFYFAQGHAPLRCKEIYTDFLSE